MGLNPPWAFAHISWMKFLKIKILYPKIFFLLFDLYTCTFYASCYLSWGNNFLLIWEMISSCSEPSELDSIVWIVNKNSFHFHILTLLQYILTLVNTFWYESIYYLVQNLMNFPFLHKKQVLVKWFNDELPIDTYHF